MNSEDPRPAADIFSSDVALVEFWLSRKTDKTRDSYRIQIKKFTSFLKDAPLAGVTVLTLEQFASALAAEAKEEPAPVTKKKGPRKKRLSPASQTLAMAAAKSLLTFAFRMGAVKKNIGELFPNKRPKADRAKKALSLSEVDALIGAVSNRKHRMMLRLIYFSGIRVAEACALCWSDAISDGRGGGLIRVQGKGDKTRSIALHQTAWDELAAFRCGAPDSHPIFPSQIGKGDGHLGRVGVNHFITAAAKRAGLGHKKISPHWLRHTHATISGRNGASIWLLQDTLGHASVSTTALYIESDPSDSSSKYLK
jgi:integrase/recombinase XerD